jgi:alpha-beta hydrolase superfamily lysophospholipase
MPTVTRTAHSFVDAEGVTIHYYVWKAAKPRGVLQLTHGLGDHALRYERVAQDLVAAGYTVYADDHRGHGASITGTPGDFGAPGFEGLIADMAAYGAKLRGDLPLFLVAHSMGSFAAQSVILGHSEQYAGVVLSGSTALDLLAAGLAEAEGPVGLEAFNAGFVHRTGYEWLSRDEAEVDRYVADPLCGFDLPDDGRQHLFGATPDHQQLAVHRLGQRGQTPVQEVQPRLAGRRDQPGVEHEQPDHPAASRRGRQQCGVVVEP